MSNGSIDISKGYYNDGTHTIIMPAGQHSLSDLTTGQTLGGKNSLFATSYNDVAKPVMSSLNAPTGTYDVYVDLEHPVYLSYEKNYIAGDKLMSGVAWTFEKGGSIITDYTVVGSPTISSDYILSGTSNSNYVKSTTTTPSSITTFDFITKYTKTESSSNLAYIFCDVASNAILYSQSQNKIGWYDSNDGDVVGTTAMSLNTTYWVRMKIEDTTMRLYSLEDNNYTLSTLPDISNWTLEATKTNFTKARLQSKTLDLGANPTTGNYGLRGTLDMKETIFTINGEVWWSPVDVTIASVSAPKSLLYNTTQDSTYWLPSAQTVLLSSLTSSDLLTRNNLYLTNTTGSDVSAFTFRKNAPSTTEYWQQPEYVYLTQDKTQILGVGTEPDEIVLKAIAGTGTANYSVIGTISVNDQHEATGFSTSNYIYLTNMQTYSTGTITSLEMIFKIHTPVSGNWTSNGRIINGSAAYDDFALDVNSERAQFTFINSDTSTDKFLQLASNLSNDTDYWLKVTYDGTDLKGFYSTNGVDYTQTDSIARSSSELYLKAGYSIGARSYDHVNICVWNGSIDLSESYIKVNGSNWWQPYTGTLDTVSVSSEHYWSYYGTNTVNLQGVSEAISGFSPTSLTGHLMGTTAGALTYSENNAQGEYGGSGAYWTGYDLTFTDNTYAEIDSVTKTGELCRVYYGHCTATGYEATQHRYVYVPYRKWDDLKHPYIEQYRSVVMGYSTAGLIMAAEIDVQNTATVSYDWAADEFVVSRFSSDETTLEYIGDYYTTNNVI